MRNLPAVEDSLVWFTGYWGEEEEEGGLLVALMV